jgi:hypothetical protein
MAHFTLAEYVILWLGSASLLGILVGLFVRGRQRVCRSFTAYVAAVGLPQVMYSTWPDRFYNADFWMFGEVTHCVLKFAIALEVGFLVLRRFPGASRTGRWAGLLVVWTIFFAILALPAENPDYYAIAGKLLPRILNGTVWLFVALAGVVLWYRLPLDPLHKAIVLGFVPYLLVFSVAMTLLDTFGWEHRLYTGYLHTLAYLALEIYWAWAAWRLDPPGVARATIPVGR